MLYWRRRWQSRRPSGCLIERLGHEGDPMPYDLIIRNGTIIDGSGLPRFRADVGMLDGKVATIGKIRDQAKDMIDAEGHIVAPGFVDGHTHMDAQVCWDPL